MAGAPSTLGIASRGPGHSAPPTAQRWGALSSSGQRRALLASAENRGPGANRAERQPSKWPPTTARPPWEAVVRPEFELDEEGQHPLHGAAERGNLPAVLRLLDPPYLMRHGADPNVRVAGKPHNPMPLHLAANKGHSKVVAALLKYGADSNAEAYVRSSDGLTPLQLAAERGCARSVHALLAAGADAARAEPLLHRTALHLAAEGGHLEAVLVLMGAKGVDLDARSEYGWTPLMRAADYGADEVIAALAAAGAAVDAAGSQGETSLHLAACNGDADTVRVLLAAGARVGRVGPLQDTALHVAAYKGSTAVVAQLLAAGAPVGARNQAGKTPEEVAVARGNAEVADLLYGAGRGATGQAVLKSR